MVCRYTNTRAVLCFVVAMKVFAWIIALLWYMKMDFSWTLMPALFNSPLLNSKNFTRIGSATEQTSPSCQKFPDDIQLFDTAEKDVSFCCKACAIVSSSGTMLDSNAGVNIDQNECVIRINNAPTRGFEKDVGTRTTFRFYSHTSVIDVKNLLATDTSEINSTIFLVWGPKNNMLPGRITYNHLKDNTRRSPGIKQYIISQERMQKSDDIFEIEVGKNRQKSGAYLSTGYLTVLFAKDICDFIHIYGMVEDDYCQSSIPARLLHDVPYHYYGKGKPTQCATYSLHENARRGGHRFVTEKKIFKKWAREWGNVQFHNPEWDLSRK